MPRTAKKTTGRVGIATMIYLDPKVRTALDAYLATYELRPTRTLALHVAIKEFLVKRNAWPGDANDER